MYSGPPVLRTPGWSGDFSAKQSPVISTEIITTVYYYCYYYSVSHTISALRSFTSGLSDGYLYVTCSKEFHLGGPDSRLIRTTPALLHFQIQMTCKLMHVPALRLLSIYKHDRLLMSIDINTIRTEISFTTGK